MRASLENVSIAKTPAAIKVEKFKKNERPRMKRSGSSEQRRNSHFPIRALPPPSGAKLPISTS